MCDSLADRLCVLQVLQLVPTAPPLLVAAAADRVPHVLRDRATQVLFTPLILGAEVTACSAACSRADVARVQSCGKDELSALTCE